MDRDGAQEAQGTFVSGGKTGRQVRGARKDGWTQGEIGLFLDHYAKSGNAAPAWGRRRRRGCGVFERRPGAAEAAPGGRRQ